MPQTRKLAWAQLRVGLAALAAISILVVLIFLLTGTGGLFRKTARIRIYVDDSASLKVGAPVRLNGIDIGNVEHVRLSGESQPNRQIEIVAEVVRDFLPSIPADSEAAINPEGVFGDKYINITRGKSDTAVTEGGEIRSLDTREFQEIVNQSYNVMTSLNSITKRIDAITSQVEQGKGTVGKLLYDETLYNKIDGVVTQAQQAVALVNDGKGTIGKLLADDEIYNQTSGAIRRVDLILADVQAGKGTLGMLLRDPSIYDNANRMILSANKTVDNLNAGQGTLGKLLRDEALYRQLNETVGKVDAMVDRVNTGQGTIGQLLVNRALYDSITGMAAESQQLIREIRSNPRKFLRIKLALF